MSPSLRLNIQRIFTIFIICTARGNFVQAKNRQNLGSRHELITTEVPEQQTILETIPRIPDGHKQYQFYTLNSKGDLQKQWMSLQEVQNFILTHAYEKHNKMTPSLVKRIPYNNAFVSNNDFLKRLADWNDPGTRPQTSIDDVLANVQKVMSKEVTHSLMRDDTNIPQLPVSYIITESTTSATEGTPELTFPQKILANLLREQVGSLQTHSPWGFMSSSIKSFADGNMETNYLHEKESTTELPAENFLFDEDYEKATSVQVEATTSKDSLEMEPQSFNENMLHSIYDSQPKVFSPSSSEYDEYHIFTATSIPSIGTTKYNLPVESTTAASIDISTRELPTYSIIPVVNLDKQDYSDEQLNFLNYFKTTTEWPTTEYSTSTVSSENLSSTTTHYDTKDPQDIVTEVKHTISIKINDPLNDSSINSVLDNVNKATASTPTDNTYSDKLIRNDLKDFSENYNIKEELPSSNVLSPSEIAQISSGNIGTLGDLEGKTDADYSFYDEAIYIEDLVPEQEFDLYGDLNSQKPANPIKQTFDFPKPNVTNSYHNPEHVGQVNNPIHIHPKPTKTQSQTHDSTLDDVDPTQFLPAFNPALAKGQNPLQETPLHNIGLEASTNHLTPDVKKYIDTMNNLSFQIYKRAAKIHRRQNMIMAPINLISTLSMLQLATRGMTAGALSKLLQSEEFVSFNPHLLLKNITESFVGLNFQNHDVGIVNNVFIAKPRKEPYSVEFFSQRMKFFYNALVEQVPGQSIGSNARDRANEEIRAQTSNVVHNFLKPDASLTVDGPLSVVSSAYFQGNWGVDIAERDLIDMNFIRFPSAERRLIKTVGIMKRMNINAGYSKELDATVAEIPLSSTAKEISLVLVMPGQQKSFIANGLSKLEQDLSTESWSKLIKSVIPHRINFKMPIFSHRNYLNLTGILTQVGLAELFEESADFSGINGNKDLYLGDLVQLSEFHSCKLDAALFSKTYRMLAAAAAKGTSRTRRRSKQIIRRRRSSSDQHSKNSRQVTKPEDLQDAPILRDQKSNFYRNDNTLAYDRAFFYILRHNPTGLVLFIGRYLDPETF